MLTYLSEIDQFHTRNLLVLRKIINVLKLILHSHYIFSHHQPDDIIDFSALNIWFGIQASGLLIVICIEYKIGTLKGHVKCYYC